MTSLLDDKEKVKQALLSHDSLLGVIRELDLRPGGNTYSRLKDLCAEFEIDVPSGWRSRTVHPSKKSLREILVRDSAYNRTHLRLRLIKEGLLKEECDSCGLGPSWNDKPLTLQIEHINGIHNDNRLDNLCLLCPNCHTQTETFSGRNVRRVHPRSASFCACGNSKTPSAKACMGCRELPPRKTKIDWPDSQDLIARKAAGESYEAIGRDLGVTGAAVKKRILRR